MRLPLFRCTAALAAAMVFASAALAASPKVGEDAPEIGQATWVLNEPLVTSIADLRGEVVFVERWGVKCGPCLALIPHVQKLHTEFAGKGLHIFAFESQNHSAEETRATALARGCKTYPVATGGAGAYQTDGGIPHAWIIGVDGKVKWTGNPGDGACDRILREELAKVKFPGLGLADVHKSLSEPAKRWLRGDLGGARALAAKLLDKGILASEARAQAELLVTRADQRARLLGERADRLAGEKRYTQASALLEEIRGAYEGQPEGEAADERLKAWKKDKEISRELAAEAALAQVMQSLERKPADVRAATLEAFAASDKFAGTRAAAEAAEAAKAARSAK